VSWIPDVNWLEVGSATVDILIVVGVVVAGLVGIVLTVLTLPGMWVTLALCLLLWWAQPDLFSWWTLLIALLIAGLGELIEFIASALGAAKGGATRAGMVGAAVGSIVGAVAGAPFFFPIGSIVGGVIGAAVGAIIAERGTSASSTWGHAARAGTGAAVGRLAATLGKAFLAGAMALLLALAAIIP
jgi:uncharacterized protein YqgC (DUF456 family)